MFERLSADNPVAPNLHAIRVTDGIFQQAAVFLDDAFRGNILCITCDQQTFHAKLSGSFDTKPQGFGAVTAIAGVRYDAVADMATILGQIVVQCQTQTKYANQRSPLKKRPQYPEGCLWPYASWEAALPCGGA